MTKREQERIKERKNEEEEGKRVRSGIIIDLNLG